MKFINLFFTDPIFPKLLSISISYEFRVWYCYVFAVLWPVIGLFLQVLKFSEDFRWQSTVENI